MFFSKLSKLSKLSMVLLITLTLTIVISIMFKKKEPLASYDALSESYQKSPSEFLHSLLNVFNDVYKSQIITKVGLINFYKKR